ncbi:MAG: hypothetical protein FVQ81_13845 [Candidatus Glassbacteria bacterium]|nr:hypothetical protein [Candidatus Glassbacteria bacterium]
MAVDESNRYRATQFFFEDIRGHFNKTLAIITHSDTSEAIRVMGNHNGYALARALVGTDTTAVPAVLVEYVNYYSETGMLFYAGGLELFGEWRYIGGAKRMSKFIVRGTTDISGDYACQLTFENFHMALAPNGLVLNMQAMIDSVAKYGPTNSLPLAGTVIITSGSETIRFNPYFFDYGPG